MSKYQRRFVEVLVPPFLGAFGVMVTDRVDTFADKILGFFPFVAAAYVYAIVPSLVYMLVMETWFWFDLRARCGLFCTVVLSASLGCGAGLALEYVIDFGQILSWKLVWIGGVVGLLIGFYVGRRSVQVA
ncbi:MAG: hypothetical protein ACREDS_03965 [Limisphaerales bacterium]